MTLQQAFNKYGITHFREEEFLRSSTALRMGIDNYPMCQSVFKNLLYLASYLETVRDEFGSPIIITSGYRNSEVNKLVGGVPHSRHLSGCAVDIYHITNYEINDDESFGII